MPTALLLLLRKENKSRFEKKEKVQAALNAVLFAWVPQHVLQITCLAPLTILRESLLDFVQLWQTLRLHWPHCSRRCASRPHFSHFLEATGRTIQIHPGNTLFIDGLGLQNKYIVFCKEN